jgi:hypothetical protein
MERRSENRPALQLQRRHLKNKDGSPVPEGQNEVAQVFVRLDPEACPERTAELSPGFQPGFNPGNTHKTPNRPERATDLELAKASQYFENATPRMLSGLAAVTFSRIAKFVRRSG